MVSDEAYFCFFCTSRIDVSKAGNPAVGAVVEFTAVGSQAHRTDVVCEFDWSTELKQSNVVVTGAAVVTGMGDDPTHIPGLTVGVAAF